MMDPVHPLEGPRPPRALARRTLLTVGGAAVLAGTAGCNPFSTTKVTRTVTTSAPDPIDPMDTLIAMTRLHMLRLEAGMTTGGSAQSGLKPLRDDRLAHLQWLLAEQSRVNRAPESAVTEPGQTVAAPASRADAMASAAQDAADAQLAFSDQIPLVSKYRAAMFASITACLATHRVILR